METSESSAPSAPPPYSATDKTAEACPPYPPASGGYPVTYPQAGGPFTQPNAGCYPSPATSGYPPYPPAGGYSGYPTSGGGMPQPQIHSVSDQPGHGHGGGTTATNQPKPVATTTVVIQSRGDCPKCYVGHIVETFTLAGICCAIWFFPCGIFCCLSWRRRICSNCGAIYI